MKTGTSDSMGTLVGINFLLGCGLLTPWNSLITAVDFFSALFPNMDPADAFAVANFAANLIFLILQIVWVQRVSTLKASLCFALYLAVLGFSLWLALAFTSPFSDKNGGQTQELHFYVLVGCVAVAGAASSGLQSVLYSIAGELGPVCITSFMNGQAFAGILTCICRILSKVGFSHHPAFEALRLSSALYLSSSLAVVIMAFFGFFAIQRMRSQRKYLDSEKDLAHRIESEALISGRVEDEDCAQPAPELENFGDIEAGADGRPVWKRIWVSAMGVIVTFWITLAVFPGVTCRIPASQPDPEEWMAVVLITIFNVGDLLGRMIAGAVATSLSEGALWALSVARVGFIPLLVYLQADGSTGGGQQYHEAVAIVSVLAMATTSGFLACSFIIKGQLRVTSNAEREIASTLLALAVTLGLALGAVSALPLRKLVI